MIVAKCGNLYGYINSNGEECIPLKYSHADDFSEGLAAVKNEKGKYLFIDASGVMVIKPHEYDRVGHFQNGTCKVYRKNKVWEIDREGKKVKKDKDEANNEEKADNKQNKSQSSSKASRSLRHYYEDEDEDEDEDNSPRKKKSNILKDIFKIEVKTNDRPSRQYSQPPIKVRDDRNSENGSYRRTMRFGNQHRRNR